MARVEKDHVKFRRGRDVCDLPRPPAYAPTRQVSTFLLKKREKLRNRKTILATPLYHVAHVHGFLWRLSFPVERLSRGVNTHVHSMER